VTKEHKEVYFSRTHTCYCRVIIVRFARISYPNNVKSADLRETCSFSVLHQKSGSSKNCNALLRLTLSFHRKFNVHFSAAQLRTVTRSRFLRFLLHGRLSLRSTCREGETIGNKAMPRRVAPRRRYSSYSWNPCQSRAIWTMRGI